MATVTLRLSGGPCDGETGTIEVTDPDEPPEVYRVHVHGPHEAVEHVDYHRFRREPDGGLDDGVWTYQAPGV